MYNNVRHGGVETCMSGRHDEASNARYGDDREHSLLSGGVINERNKAGRSHWDNPHKKAMIIQTKRAIRAGLLLSVRIRRTSKRPMIFQARTRDIRGIAGCERESG